MASQHKEITVVDWDAPNCTWYMLTFTLKHPRNRWFGVRMLLREAWRVAWAPAQLP